MSAQPTPAPCGYRVTVGELAAQLGWPDDHLARRLDALGYQVAPDWAGRPSITVDDAARMVRETREESNT